MGLRLGSTSSVKEQWALGMHTGRKKKLAAVKPHGMGKESMLDKAYRGLV